MSFDGLYGDGLYGEEYYSARVQDQNAGPMVVAASSFGEFGQVIRISTVNAITALSNLVSQANAVVRTSGAAIVALSSAVWSGVKFWEPVAEPSSPWTADPDTASNPWTTQTDASSPWSTVTPGTPQ